MRYVSPLHVLTELVVNARAGGSGADLAATTLVTTPNQPDWDGAVYEVYAYVYVSTAAGAAETLTVNIVATTTPSGGSPSARTITIPFATEAGAYAATVNANAVGSYNGSIVFKADKNTNVQYSLTHSAANVGAYDIVLSIRRVK